MIYNHPVLFSIFIYTNTPQGGGQEIDCPILGVDLSRGPIHRCNRRFVIRPRPTNQLVGSHVFVTELGEFSVTVGEGGRCGVPPQGGAVDFGRGGQGVLPVRATPIGLRIHPEGVAMLSKEPLGVVWVRVRVRVRG